METQTRKQVDYRRPEFCLYYRASEADSYTYAQFPYNNLEFFIKTLRSTRYTDIHIYIGSTLILTVDLAEQTNKEVYSAIASKLEEFSYPEAVEYIKTLK